jgi:hypothetical protein
MNRPPLRWTLWHPHQKLWNWRLEALLRRIGRRIGITTALINALVAIDSALLFLRVFVWRTREFGIVESLRPFGPTDRRVLYVDCGVHKYGEQLRSMQEWFADRCDLRLLAFEASGEHCRDAGTHLADLRNLDLRNFALVGPDAIEASVKLYKGPLDGRGDSLVLRQSDRYEVVPARRLSEVLREEFGDWLTDTPVILRMNIEGSEYDVIDDLVRSGVAEQIDGYFGMWDDVAKIDPARERGFRRLLDSAGIRSVTFNDRDLSHPLRRRAIRLAVDGAIRRGLEVKPGAR